VLYDEYGPLRPTTVETRSRKQNRRLTQFHLPVTKQIRSLYGAHESASESVLECLRVLT
jgi:hypothetical protein